MAQSKKGDETWYEAPAILRGKREKRESTLEVQGIILDVEAAWTCYLLNSTLRHNQGVVDGGRWQQEPQKQLTAYKM